jgi:hypothetical protein
MQLGSKELWMKEELDIRCWESKHLDYVKYVGVPAMIIWVIGIPAVFLYFLVKNYIFVSIDSVKLKYGFLLLGLRKGCYYWYERTLTNIGRCSVYSGMFFSFPSIPLQLQKDRI